MHPRCENEHWLALPEIAKIVVDAIHFGAAELGRYQLHAFVVMSNHVHLLIDPHVDAVVILKNLKGITARRANATLDRSGAPFWQEESFDHWIRDEAEFRETARYIEYPFWNG